MNVQKLPSGSELEGLVLVTQVQQRRLVTSADPPHLCCFRVADSAFVRQKWSHFLSFVPLVSQRFPEAGDSERAGSRWKGSPHAAAAREGWSVLLADAPPAWWGDLEEPCFNAKLSSLCLWIKIGLC